MYQWEVLLWFGTGFVSENVLPTDRAGPDRHQAPRSDRPCRRTRGGSAAHTGLSWRLRSELKQRPPRTPRDTHLVHEFDFPFLLIMGGVIMICYEYYYAPVWLVIMFIMEKHFSFSRFCHVFSIFYDFRVDTFFNVGHPAGPTIFLSVFNHYGSMEIVIMIW